MARFRVCPVCRADHFKRVTVKLPSGKHRVTDFEACDTCRVVLYLPETPAVFDDDTARNKELVPAEVTAAIIAALPEPSLATTKGELTEYYIHPELGRMALLFKRMRKAEGGPFFWHLDGAKLLS